MRLIQICAVVAALLYAEAGLAWSKFGHLVVCEIAYRELSDPARERLVELVKAAGERSFNHACLFADRHPRQRPREHFMNLSRSTPAVTDGRCVNASKCVLSAIRDDLMVVADEDRNDAERGRALILLGHWVGDAHQPLHISFADDAGGNSVLKRGTCSARNLHAVWDKCIVDRRVLRDSPGRRKWTKAYRAADRLLESVTTEQRDQWTTSAPWHWAAESYAIARSPEVQYCFATGRSCWYAPDNESLEASEPKRVFLSSDEYLDLHQPTVELRLKMAGIRLAAILNGVLGEP